jgi:hypothetical protein
LAIKNNSFHWAFISGAAFYVFLYFSFSLLPVVVLGFTWWFLNWLNFNQTEKKRALLTPLVFGVGILLMLLILYLTLNYDPFTRYTIAMSRHRETHAMITGFERIPDMLVLNNAELITYTGFPIIVLFISNLIRSVKKGLNIKFFTQSEMLLVSFSIMVLFLNFFGQTMGEVQRLWLFLVPLLCLFSAQETENMGKMQRYFLIVILVFQIISAYLLYRYQDFYG